ncbi:hypothetical protein VKI21_09480 [Cyanobacterium aponinum UTEX 3222]|uniref:Uncharacterized protein n=3 Tax=Cyanobacterium aponinum TaxID=379064 RepID=K9Z1W4_CYAAP|nr:hypothetical protein [Cyanobacterium aponinum]WRL43895.1 hypothetical protein VKI21_09480 [Cyanobacterium aponinum UTEX 3222]AFZ52373.1 hypothetical protein Cyan10605_0219 [Cyanobacterium aponinum PCC 10605]MBD2393752.1 hypothetical protein [Cyanobacterium aponinum FACHB-4101]MTF37705.1 hypothetical protein [Cyanobacterium aponinum 0216]WPF87617.1 hypothetical protein SAY89_12470 [Cyanobacterium aponinum AL20115]
MLNNQQFLTQEESLAVEASLLTSEEKFLTRLTISSLRVLQLIAQDLDVSVDSLSSEQIIAWMEKDSKVRREQGIDKAILKW